MKKDQEAYDKLVEILFEKHYNKLIKSGKNENSLNLFYKYYTLKSYNSYKNVEKYCFI